MTQMLEERNGKQRAQSVKKVTTEKPFIDGGKGFKIIKTKRDNSGTWEKVRDNSSKDGVRKKERTVSYQN